MWITRALLFLPLLLATGAGAVEHPIPDNPLISIPGGRFIYLSWGAVDGAGQVALFRREADA